MPRSKFICVVGARKPTGRISERPNQSGEPTAALNQVERIRECGVSITRRGILL